MRGFCRQEITYNSLAAAVPTTTARMVNNTAKVVKNRMLMLQQLLLRRKPTQFWGQRERSMSHTTLQGVVLRTLEEFCVVRTRFLKGPLQGVLPE